MTTSIRSYRNCPRRRRHDSRFIVFSRRVLHYRHSPRHPPRLAREEFRRRRRAKWSRATTEWGCYQSREGPVAVDTYESVLGTLQGLLVKNFRGTIGPNSHRPQLDGVLSIREGPVIAGTYESVLGTLQGLLMKNFRGTIGPNSHGPQLDGVLLDT